MMYIKKGQEPLSLTEYRQQPYATYEGYDKKMSCVRLFFGIKDICAPTVCGASRTKTGTQ